MKKINSLAVVFGLALSALGVLPAHATLSELDMGGRMNEISQRIEFNISDDKIKQIDSLFQINQVPMACYFVGLASQSIAIKRVLVVGLDAENQKLTAIAEKLANYTTKCTAVL